jgi:hypothetical protein
MFYKLNYFKKSSEGIYATDFENHIKTDSINLNLVCSLSELLSFGNSIVFIKDPYYAIVTMNNGEKYYIGLNQYEELSLLLENHDSANLPISNNEFREILSKYFDRFKQTEQ